MFNSFTMRTIVKGEITSTTIIPFNQVSYIVQHKKDNSFSVYAGSRLFKITHDVYTQLAEYTKWLESVSTLLSNCVDTEKGTTKDEQIFDDYGADHIYFDTILSIVEDTLRPFESLSTSMCEYCIDPCDATRKKQCVSNSEFTLEYRRVFNTIISRLKPMIDKISDYDFSKIDDQEIEQIFIDIPEEKNCKLCEYNGQLCAHCKNKECFSFDICEGLLYDITISLINLLEEKCHLT